MPSGGLGMHLSELSTPVAYRNPEVEVYWHGIVGIDQIAGLLELTNIDHTMGSLQQAHAIV